MPVFPKAPPLPAVGSRDQLVDQLADELQVVGERGEPLIFENPVQATDKFFVIVVWSAWVSIPWSQRTGIILDAYRRVEATHPDAPPRARQITMASGLTWEEADLQAFFPFSVTPNVLSNEITPGEVRKAMLEEGGVETPTGVKLRFKMRESAEKAYARLQQELPNARWSLNQIVARIQDE
jgi:hypothetical protein